MDNNNLRTSLAGDKVTEMVVTALRRIMHAVDMRSRRLISSHGITGPQIMILKVLSVLNGSSVGELTREVHLSQATVTGILDRLEKRGLVERQRSDVDKRKVNVSLTRAGEKILADAPPLLQEKFMSEFAKLEDWEQTQILSSLQRIVSMMEASDIRVEPILTSDSIEEISTKQ
jgi:DNA-binding MarR family transcriptional regulator